MPRKQLPTGGGYVQEYPNSCWACCTRFVNNYCVSQLGYPGQQYLTDGGVAQHIGLNVNAETDINDVWKTCGMHGGTDSEYIPTFDEIVAEIDNGHPICVCINPTRHGYLCKEPIVGGHYVVITGYDTDLYQICVMDPADGSITWHTYAQTTLQAGEYWCGAVYSNGQGIH